MADNQDQSISKKSQKIDDTEIKQGEAHLNSNENLYENNSNLNKSNSEFDQYSNDIQNAENSNDITKYRDQKSLKEKNSTDSNKDKPKLKKDQNEKLHCSKQFQSNEESNIDLSLFSIVDNIGHGNFGDVYLVENKQTNKQYAAKVSKKAVDLHQSDFYNEISFYSKIECPSILKLHGYSSHDFCGNSRPTMILDYMKNGTLADFLAKKEKSSKYVNLFKTKKFIILMGIVLGMNTLHSHGIIHRDLKPENILLDENYYPKICDFGVSIISDKELLRHQRSAIGTPYYFAPEITLKEAPYSYKVDVFSFSLIAYELLTGKEPFPKKKGFVSKRKIWSEIEKGYRPNLSIIPDPKIRSLIGRCWSRDPEERPSFFEIFNDLNKSKCRFGVDDLELMNYLNFFKESFNHINFSMKNIKEQADNDNIEAMLIYATKLYAGQDFPQDKEKALHYMKKASDLGSDNGTYMYASHLLDSENVMDRREANCLLKQLADKGYERAILDYGANLVHGRGCKKDFEEAIKYFKIAADNQNAEALFDYGTMFYQGRGVKVNKKMASEYYQLSADLGNRNAMYEFARMSFSGDGIEQDIQNAKKYFEMAAFQNDTGAMMYLALMYIDGSYSFNPNLSKYWFLKCGKLKNNILFCNAVKVTFKKDKNDKYNLELINQFKDFINSINNSDSMYDFGSSCLKFAMSFLFGTSNDNNSANINMTNQNKTKDTNRIKYNGLIDQIKVKTYSSFICDSEEFYHFIDDNLIPKKFKKQIDDYANSLHDIKILRNVCEHDDLNSIRTYYIFTSVSKTFDFQHYVFQLFRKNNYDLFLASQYNIHFDENLIPSKYLNVFIKFLESSPLVINILRNVFDGGKVATYINVLPKNQNDFKKSIKDFLLSKNLIFDTSSYPLENDIIIKDHMIFDKKEDFDVIVNEIKSMKTQKQIIPEKIQRYTLYFYNNHCNSNLFQVSSFICFKNKVDKMIALNHINKIVYEGKNNILTCDLNLHYATIDDTVYPTKIRKLIPEIFKNIKGVKDFQPYVLSIESPIERTYIGFDSMENLKNGYLRFSHILNILLKNPNPNLFWKKDDLVYLAVIKKDISFPIIDIKIIISDLISDIQFNCTERYDNLSISVTFIGFKSQNELNEAEDRIKKDHNIHDKIDLQHYDENSTFITETCNYKDEYLFYNSF